ncbi:glycosyltransferase 87 family protein [Tersicoccus sp. MR15.9]|uniref:glycosyltransferase 87 family protein n=1 Tax=Tersicoccus mangrovi TaxID=3121635 RepID=UPI002FE64951
MNSERMTAQQGPPARVSPRASVAGRIAALRGPVTTSPLAIALHLAAAVALLTWWFTAVRPPEGLDYGVYRAGAATLYHLLGMGGDLYWPAEGLHGPRGMPFTYPPFAAMVLGPTAVLSFRDGLYLMMAVTVATAITVAVVILRWRDRENAGPAPRSLSRAAVPVIWLTVVILVSGPWRDTVFFGQINAALLFLCLVDLLGVTGRARGVLIGVAAGIKLTPLAFGLWFLARRDLRGLAWLAGGFAGTVALAFLAYPGPSLQFWSETIRETGRIGGFEYADNVAVRGALEQLGLTTTVAGVLWVPLVLAVVVAGWLVIRAGDRLDAPWLGIAGAALTMLLVSPISWSHHWVWWPLIVAAGVLLHRRIRAVGAADGATRVSAWEWAHGATLAVFTVFFLISPKVLALWTGSDVDVSTSRISAVLASLGGVSGVVLLVCWVLGVRRLAAQDRRDLSVALPSAC